MDIIPLKEGDFLVNKDKEFTHLDKAEGLTGLRMAVQPFLIVTPNDHILIDAGMGWRDNGKAVIFSVLDQHDIAPDQITKVILSHLHKDHVDGLFQEDADGYELTFSQAEIYMQEREFDFAVEQRQVPSFDVSKLLRLKDLPNVHWMDSDSGFISPEIRFEVTGGHTPFHQVFWITDGDEIAFYGGDNLPQRGYLDIDIAYKSDDDGRKAMELRQQWKKEAKEENWNILLYHDMKVPILKLD